MGGSQRVAEALRSPAVALPVLVLLLHLSCLTRYGFFRDEFYYLACTKRLDWGYVDHPPLCVFILKGITILFGESLAAMRFSVALAGAGTVALAVATARRLGAEGWAPWLAGLIPALAGMYLTLFHLYTMNAFEVLMWAVAAFLAAGGMGEAKPRVWLAIGGLIGLALLNKYSALWLVGGLFLALLATPDRRVLSRPWPWVAALLAGAIAAPHVAWLAAHDWVTLEFIRNAQDLKLAPIGPAEFVGQQAVVMNVFAAPVLLAGLGWGLAGRSGTPGRQMAVVFLAVMALLVLNGRSRVNYLAPAYTFLFPLAAVAAQAVVAERRWKPAWILAPVAAGGTLTLPLALPLAPVEFVRWVGENSPVRPPAEERTPRAPTQGYADMFGWVELAKAVSAAYQALPDADRARAVVITYNYGEAAALEHYGAEVPLPPVACGHNSYAFWKPEAWDGRVAIVVNPNNRRLLGHFREWRQVGAVDAPNAMPEQHQSPVWVVRGLKEPVAEFYTRIRRFY